MFYSKAKEDAFTIREGAVRRYNETYRRMEQTGDWLYNMRRASVDVIVEIERLISGIANTPKEFEKSISTIRTERATFHKTEQVARKASEEVKRIGAGAAIAVANGVAVATMAPTAAMWVATTFGTASTGTAIAALHGAAATNAALAWLGGGVLAAGGGGMAAGQALLALAGPIGWGIAGAAVATSALFLSGKNKKAADTAVKEAKEIEKQTAIVNEAAVKISHLAHETSMLLDGLKETARACRSMEGADYGSLPEVEQFLLGALVNDTLAMAEMLNKTI